MNNSSADKSCVTASPRRILLGCMITALCLLSGGAKGIAGCDQDTFISVTASTVAIAETGGATAQFIFSSDLMAGSGINVALQITGTATNGVDYETLPTQVTIQPFQTQAVLTLTPKPDIAVEGTETVTITIQPFGPGCVHVGFPDSATISITDGITAAPVVTGVASRKVHGSAGTFDLPLALTQGNPTTEPRTGPAHTIVFTFHKAVTGGTALVTEGVAVVGAPTFNGSEMLVPLTGVTNQQYVTVAVSDVASADGGTGGNGSIRVGFLLGDVSQNRVVTLSDLGLVNAQVAQFVTLGNFLRDVNASGTLSLADKGIVNTQVTKALPAP